MEVGMSSDHREGDLEKEQGLRDMRSYEDSKTKKESFHKNAHDASQISSWDDIKEEELDHMWAAVKDHVTPVWTLTSLVPSTLTFEALKSLVIENGNLFTFIPWGLFWGSLGDIGLDSYG
ncbi:hypothetical protein FXO37_32879 [Capsicum annuum]|nr:hypothetical protein FXO37_32879 [Capsicum annuum]